MTASALKQDAPLYTTHTLPDADAFDLASFGMVSAGQQRARPEIELGAGLMGPEDWDTVLYEGRIIAQHTAHEDWAGTSRESYMAEGFVSCTHTIPQPITPAFNDSRAGFHFYESLALAAELYRAMWASIRFSVSHQHARMKPLPRGHTVLTIPASVHAFTNYDVLEVLTRHRTYQRALTGNGKLKRPLARLEELPRTDGLEPRRCRIILDRGMVNQARRDGNIRPSPRLT